MKKLSYLMIFFSISSFSMTEREAIGALKLNMWHYKDSINNVINSVNDKSSTTQICYKIGIAEEGHEFKKSYTTVNKLRKVNASFAKYLNDILFHYVEKRVRKLKGFCFENKDSSFSVGDNESLKSEAREILNDIYKFEKVLKERIKELDLDF